MSAENRPYGIYLHVPFCLRKCNYCDFYSAPGPAEQRSAYVDRLLSDLTAAAPRTAGRVCDSVYFGGGTPTLLPPADFERILRCLRKSYVLSPDAEISAECNPATATGDALAKMREAGVNRLSVGMQSAVDAELSLLGRVGDFAATCRTVRDARAAGFDNLSLDLLFGIPAQTPDSFRKSLDAALSFSPEHLSAYSLQLEPGTPFFAQKDTLPLPDEDALCEMSETLAEKTAEAGLFRYEISNYARPGRACRHNLHYWKLDDYLGFGPAAHSLWQGKRYSVGLDRAGYVAGRELEEPEETLTFADAMTEYVMLGLRLCEGVDKSAFAARFGADFDALCGEKLRPYLQMGLAVDTGTHLFLTPKGMDVSNTILADVLPLGE